MIKLFLFYAPAKTSDSFAELKILTVAISHEVSSLHIEGSGFGVDIAVVGNDVEHIGDKHIVCTERNYLLHAALNAYGRLLNVRCCDFHAFYGVMFISVNLL